MAQQKSYAIFSSRYRPQTGGVESYTERLAHELSLQGYRVFVVTSALDDSPDVEVQEDSVNVLRLPCFSLLGGRFPFSKRNKRYVELLDGLAEENIDHVLINTRFYRHSLEGLRFAKRVNSPALVLDHGSAHLTLGNSIIDRLIEFYEHAITRKVKRFNPTFAGVSKASALWLEHFGIHTDNVIPNAIDVDEFRSIASTRDFRDEFNVKEGQKLVCFVGRLEPEKGAAEFARASRLLASEYVCAMAGEGSLTERIRSLGLNNLYLLGKVSKADLSALLRDSDIFCLPSRSEGFCTSALEAGSWGTIPVMTHVGGADEIIGINSELGRFISERNANKIAEAIKEAANLPDAVSNDLISEIRSRHSWELSVRKLMQSYTSEQPDG